MLPDFDEIGEQRCENWYFDNLLPNGMMRCGCGREFKLDEGQSFSPSPYAIPVCPTCFEEALK